MTKHVSMRFPVLLLVLTLLAAMMPGADWPCWRGPGANGISSETGWNPKGVANEKIAWRKNVGHGHSSIAVAGDYLYTMGGRALGTGRGAGWEETVYCLNSKTGQEVWRYVAPIRYQNFPGPASTPLVDGECVYTVGRDGLLCCFAAKTGKVIWRKDLVAEGLTRMPQWGMCASPVVEGERLILNAGRAGIVLNKKNGSVLWASSPDAGALSTPLLYTSGGKRLAAIAGRGTLNAVDITNGNVLWTHPWQSDSDPILDNNKVYLFGGGGRKASQLLEITAQGPVVKWENGNMANTFQSGVLINGYVYGIGWTSRNKQQLACIKLDTGEVAWRQDLGDWGALIASNNKLVILDGQGNLIVAEANPAAYTVASQIKLFPLSDWRSTPQDDPNTCWTAPVLANGRIYARTTWGDLACVDVSR